MTFSPRLIRWIATCVVCLWPGTQLHAWELDLHYGLVKWLAVQAGFTLADAEIVAAASEAPDRSDVLSATGVSVPDICPFGRVEASRHVQLYHFPSGAYPPDLPPRRVVKPGKFTEANGANRSVRQEINTDWGKSHVDRRTLLYRFGMALHPLADSWSHQGEPGIVKFIKFLECPEDTGWGHPKSRGGPYSHDADLTHEFPTDALETAETIYRFMDYFLTNTGLRRRAAKNFSALVDDIKNFAARDTKLGKYKWFTEEQNDVLPFDAFSTYPCFLELTNTDDDIYEFDTPEDEGFFDPSTLCAEPKAKPTKPKPSVQVDQRIEGQAKDGSAANRVDEFLRRWVVDREYEAVAAQFVNWEAIRSSLLGTEAAAVTNFYSAWQRTLLEMWLVRDHGRVNSLGHGLLDPDRRVPLVNAVANLTKIDSADSISDVIRSVRGTGPYDLYPLGPDRGYLVTFKFKHIAHDVVFLHIIQQDQRWRIAAFGWIAH